MLSSGTWSFRARGEAAGASGRRRRRRRALSSFIAHAHDVHCPHRAAPLGGATRQPACAHFFAASIAATLAASSLSYSAVQDDIDLSAMLGGASIEAHSKSRALMAQRTESK